MTVLDRPHVVIVGAGFGGLYAVRALKGAEVRTTVIDRHNYHLFQPLLYQVGTATLSSNNIAYPIRAIARRQTNTHVIMAEVVAIEPSEHNVRLRDGEIGYDYLIRVADATHSYFGHLEWEPHAPGLKGIEDAWRSDVSFLGNLAGALLDLIPPGLVVSEPNVGLFHARRV